MSSSENSRPLGDRLIRLFPLWIAVLGLLAYAGSFACAFIFDDHWMVSRVSQVDRLWPFHRLFTGSRRWVVDLTFSLNHIFGRLNPADFHAVNLLIHILAAWTLYGLVRRTLRLPVWAGRYSGRMCRLAAGLVAVIWVVHPLNTQSVTYISQRFESMMALFYLLVLYCLARAGASSRPAVWNSLSIFVLGIGAGTKEVIVTAPVVMLLYDHVFLSGEFRRFLRRRGILLLLILSVLLWISRSVWWPALTGIRAGMHITAGISPLVYMRTQAGVILYYLRLAVIPHPLCFDYGWPPAQSLFPVLLPGLVVVFGWAWAMWAAVRRCSAAGFLWASFFVILAPTSSLLPLQDMAAEHRMYLPLTAVVSFIVLAGINRCAKGLISPSYASWARFSCAGVTAAVVLVLLSLTVSRNRIYASEETIWRDVLAKRPDNLRAYPNLAVSLLRQNRFAEAADCARNLLVRAPDYSGMTSEEIGRMTAGEINPNLHFAPLYCAHAYNVLGIDALERNSLEESARYLNEAIRIKPGFMDPYSNLAVAFLRMGDIQRAVDGWSRVLKISPRNVTARSNLAMIRMEQGEYVAAKENLEKAIALDPYHISSRYQLAWLLATCPEESVRDGVRAVSLAESLRRETKFMDHWDVLDLLSVAYAECDRFTDAAEAVKKAIRNAELAADPVRGRGADIAGMQERLKLYESGKPFRIAEKKRDSP